MRTYENTIPEGTLINGKAYQYEILRVLGQGSFGITYLASIKMSGELGAIDAFIAIKEFFMSEINGRDDLTVTTSNKTGLFDKYKRKFIKEAQSLSKLKHPNIVKVLESFECNNTVYYSMNFIDGGSLDDYISQKGYLNEQETLIIGSRILDALSYMHKKNILHLDLKPSNIMMYKGNPVLIDFGLSKHYDETGIPESSTTIGAGTPGYAPIEQSNYNGDLSESGNVPITMDIYALGATMFKMLTGRKPPIASNILNNGFPEHELIAKNVSKGTRNLVRALMEPQWKDRPQRDATVRDKFKELYNDPSEDTSRVSALDVMSIEDYTMDDCKAFFKKHDAASDPNWEDVYNHYQSLLKKHENNYSIGESLLSWSRRVSKLNALKNFRNISQPATNLSKAIKNTGFKFITQVFKSIFFNANKRHIVTNILLYVLLLSSLIYVLPLLGPDSDYINTPDLQDAIPFILLSIGIFSGIMKIIHWKMSGISVLICVTTLFWTYEYLSSNWWIFYDYLCGSSASFLSVLLLYGILHLKKNGISTWALCKDAPQWLLYINRTMITIWLVIIIILPPTIGFAIGFRHNIYSNGELCINAYLNNVSDCYRLYLKTLFDSDYSDDVNNKEHMAGFWLSKVQTICKIEGYHFLDDEISNERLFLDKLIFINNNKGHEAAIQYIASDGDSINFSYIYEFITSIPILYEDIYEPYKNRIIDLLHETSVLDKIDDSTSYSSDDNY